MVAALAIPTSRPPGVVLASGFSDPHNERLILGAVAGLILLGVAMIVVTVVWWRNNRIEHAALAPLEVMGERSWWKGNFAERRRRLDDARGRAREEHGETVDLVEAQRSFRPGFADLLDDRPATSDEPDTPPVTSGPTATQPDDLGADELVADEFGAAELDEAAATAGSGEAARPAHTGAAGPDVAGPDVADRDVAGHGGPDEQPGVGEVGDDRSADQSIAGDVR